MKRILLVHCPDIKYYPPVISLVENLLENGHRVTLIVKDETSALDFFHANLRVIKLYPPKGRFPITDLIVHREYQKKLQMMVIEEMKDHDLLWTTTDTTVRELSDVVLRYCHVMQVLELIKDIPKTPYQDKRGLHIEKYAQKAWKVVVSEYNRAHIQKTWWNLRTLPIILPNKPYRLPSDTQIPDSVRSVVDEISQENKRIILYQGTFEDDRNLEPYAEAFEHHKDKYVFYVMGRDNEIRDDLCKKYPHIKYIPFIKPPFHLCITKKAHIGILPYVPTKAFHYSELNALFCAPNKIFEYAAYQLPMIGSCVPGLEIPFLKYGIGVSCEPRAHEISKALTHIEENYQQMQTNCNLFYSNTNLDDIVNRQILEDK